VVNGFDVRGGRPRPSPLIFSVDSVFSVVKAFEIRVDPRKSAAKACDPYHWVIQRPKERANFDAYIFNTRTGEAFMLREASKSHVTLKP
jgi:hypothetical protein